MGVAAVRIYARVWAKLARRGITIGSHDVMIGATCISLGFSVVSLDFRDFEKIPGIKVEKITL